MSTFLNTTSNVTAPLQSCSYLDAISPPANNTLASCSIPDCESNRAAVEQCCSGGTITTFNETRNVTQENITINAEYLVCTFDVDVSGYNTFTPYAPNETVFALPDCLVRNGASRVICNRPSPDPYSAPGCFWNGFQSPQGTGEGFSTCGGNNNNVNFTNKLRGCCQQSNGTIRAEQEGCAVSCSGDETLTSCMQDGPTFASFSCGNNSDKGGAHSLGGSGKTTLASVALAAVVAVAMLL